MTAHELLESIRVPRDMESHQLAVVTVLPPRG
jgi:hypothetical protein